MLVNWNELEWKRIERGPLRGARQRLGVAAGCAHAGLSRYRLGPGERAMPVHVHADEEEIFYVLSGRGLSWQDGRTYAVGAGDCIIHPVNGAPHTIVALDEGLDALAFGSGSDTGMTFLPRAQAWWMGPRWLPSDGPNPFELEAAAGELHLPAPEEARPTTIVATDAIAPEPMSHGSVQSERRDLGVAGGSLHSGLVHIEVAAGAANAPFHCHGAEEEIFAILAGGGTLRLGEERHPIVAGDVIARPPGTGVAHQFIAGQDGLTLLAWGTRETNDTIWYADSGKLAWCGVGIRTRVEPLGYWDGEA